MPKKKETKKKPSTSNKKRSLKNQARLAGRQVCEVYSRIVGYIRPVNQWNEGKQAEFSDRKEYTIKKEDIGKKQKNKRK